jgi:hypothetical protein
LRSFSPQKKRKHRNRRPADKKSTQQNSTIIKDLKNDSVLHGKISNQADVRQELKTVSLDSVLKDISIRKTEVEAGSEPQLWDRESGNSFQSSYSLSQDRKEGWQPIADAAVIQNQGEQGTMHDSQTVTNKVNGLENKQDGLNNGWGLSENLNDQHQEESKKVEKIKKTKMSAARKDPNVIEQKINKHQKHIKGKERLKDKLIPNTQNRNKINQKHIELDLKKPNQMQITKQSSADQTRKQTGSERLRIRNTTTSHHVKVSKEESTDHPEVEKEGANTDFQVPASIKFDEGTIKQKRKVNFPGNIKNNVIDQNNIVDGNNIDPSIGKQFNNAFPANNQEKQTHTTSEQFVNTDHYDQEQNLYIVYPENSLPPYEQDTVISQNGYQEYQYPLNKAVEEQLNGKTENIGSLDVINQSIHSGYPEEGAYGDFLSFVPEQGILCISYLKN